ncbi:hypothetical protein [Cytobacillus sp. IB215316]|uniref:hypothetical protein n=1 Tax=Cytobacillus sp. IB215316 TaxID=3097354 RepID=UPI002A1357B4|nr:hypothetical protein [Cytobacillus sp. IB215316]MDX8362529.1 hypothetical protein [Cytobacillus sp. IB215316]
MSGCKCKGKRENEIYCVNPNVANLLVKTAGMSNFTNIELTTPMIRVTEKDWVAKVDTMVDLQVVTGASTANETGIGVTYRVERITSSMATPVVLCEYTVTDDRMNSTFTLTPNNTVCDEPGVGCHMYRLTIEDVNTALNTGITSNCQSLNVTTFQKG